jgi:beta-fructofuranosidase
MITPQRFHLYTRRTVAETLVFGWAMMSVPGVLAQQGPQKTITDKTLVAWASPANLTQRGGTVLTLDNQASAFDGIIFGEIAPGRWMAGSDFFRRSQREQTANPAETAGPDADVQIAIVYNGQEITLYRNGKRYARYRIGQPQTFGPGSAVLMGLRHIEATDRACFVGTITDARIYDTALDAETIASLKPNEPSEPKPLAWWSFQDGKPEDRMKTFPPGQLVGGAKIAGGKLHLPGGAYMLVGCEPPRTRATEDWPTWHVTALPSEGVGLPYDSNGCIFWKGRYHLMYIFQDPARPHGGHCWGHLSSTDLVNWTYHPASVVPNPGDPDKGIFSGNAFVNKDGVPMLCWFGIDAGVCVATAQDDGLIRWRKHPKNPIIPIPKPGQPGHGVYTVWDPYLWLEGDTYYCLLGGNQLPNKKDTLYLCKSSDMVHWTPLHPFYEHPDLSWTVEGEDCSCPDFFKLGDKRVLLCISHKVGARCYIGRYENEKFYPEQHVRMNWPGGTFFAPESLEDNQGRRIFWAWVMDPRAMTTQRATGSGTQSMPRVLALDGDGAVRITPVKELETLRRNHRKIQEATIAADSELTLDNVRGDSLELAISIDPGQAARVGLKVRCRPDGREETGIWYDRSAKKLIIDMSKSSLRKDVGYFAEPLQFYFDRKNPRTTVEAPFELREGEKLRLRVFMDKPVLEVFANDRQCVTQQVFPQGRDALAVKVCAEAGEVRILGGDAWDMAPAQFVDKRFESPAGPGVLFEDNFRGKLAGGWTWLRENPRAWRIAEGGLEIRVEPGLADTVRNALVRKVPDRAKGKLAAEVTVTFKVPPTNQYEQAGLTWYQKGRPVFKLVHEYIDGKTYIIPGKVPTMTRTVRLRLIVSADRFTAQFRPEAKGEFQTAATGALPAGAEERISIQCYNGSADAEHWVRFEDFRLLQLAE